jgi:hypothetical protein
MQLTTACSTEHLSTSAFSSNFCQLVMFELQLTRGSSHFVYLQELQIDSSGIEEAALNRVTINLNLCLLKWPESILVYAADMGQHCSDISIARDGTSCESNNLEFKNKVLYMVQQYIHLSSFGIQAALHSLGKRTSRALIQGISLSNEGSYRFDALVPTYMGLPAVDAPIHAACTPSSKGHALLSHGFALMYLLDVQLLPPRPPPIAMCELCLLNHLDTMQMLIGWLPRVHTSFITYKLPTEESPSCCFLCWSHGELALFLAFDRQEVFQGGRCAMIFRIRDLTHDHYIDALTYLDPNRLKVLHIPWDPGGSGLLGSSTTTAWGQAVFQGGRDVRDPLSTSTWAGPGQSSWAWPPRGIINRSYKYTRHHNEEGIQVDQAKGMAAPPLPPRLYLPNPLHAVLVI